MDPSLYGEVSNLKDSDVSTIIVMNKRKSYKLITVTNRINEHIADYGTDYLKIKELVKRTNQP
jgi:peptidyl-prolyl cis-trans isomerase SurA